MATIEFNNIWALGAPRRPVDQRTTRIRTVFNLLAWIGAIAAAVVAYRAKPSLPLAIFAFFMVVHVVARGIPDVITDPKKTQRAVFFALYPAICSAVLYFTYQWWGRMWLAAILGLVLGAILNGVAGAALFPQVYQEELEDTQQRVKEAWK